MIDAFNAATAGVQVADDHAHKLFRHHHLDRHDGFQQYRRGFARRLFEAHGSRNLKGHFVGINFVIAAVVEFDLDVHHFVAGEHPAFHGLLDALLDGLEVFPRHRTTSNLVDKLEAFSHLVGIDTQLHVAVVTATTSLAYV